MDGDIKVSLEEGLVYEDVVPLRWRKIDTQVPAAQLANIYSQNEEMLRFIAALEEYGAANTDEENSAHLHELARVENKINLLLDMVGQLLARQTDMPQAVLIRLSPDAIQWQSDHVPATGDQLLLDVYINKKHPNPLVFLGCVHQVEALNNGFSVIVEFKNTSEAVASALEKMIFRQHRRQIASLRTSAPSGA